MDGGGGGVAQAVKAADNRININIALTVVVGIASGHEAVLQAMREQHQRCLIFLVGIHRRVFIDHGHAGAQLLAHIDAGDGEFAGVDLDGGKLVVDVAVGGTVGGGVFRVRVTGNVGQRLDDPHKA